MLFGCIASQVQGIITLPEPFAVLDFVAGTYTIDGVDYAITDLFETDPNGTTFDPGSMITAEGLVLAWDDTRAPQAKGALLTALLLPHTFVIDFEDIESQEGQFGTYKTTDDFDGDNDYTLSVETMTKFVLGSYGELAPFGGASPWNAVRWSGLNRFGYTLGNAATNWTGNGHPISLADKDTTGFASAYTYTRLLPFGHPLDAGSTISGAVKKVKLYAPFTDRDWLVQATRLATPMNIPDDTFGIGTIGSTTVEITFPGGASADATGYEYWLYEVADTAMSWPTAATLDHWTALPSDHVIRGLTPLTNYDVYLRPTNAAGRGGIAYSDAYPYFTTAAPGSGDPTSLTLIGEDLTLAGEPLYLGS